MGGKLKYSAQKSDLTFFAGNGTKVTIPSEIKPPLRYSYASDPYQLCFVDNIRYHQVFESIA